MNRLNPIIFIIASLLLITGCAKPTPTAVIVPTSAEPTATTTALPTPTLPPMALRVNGEGILLTDYESELNRLKMALEETGKTMTPDEQKTRILTSFTDELLLAQAAVQGGFSVTDADLQARIDKLVADIGGADKLTTWQQTYGYTDESFRAYLQRSILVAWQRDQIIDSVSETADQVHARQLLYQDEGNADEAYAQLQAGAKFSDLASLQDPVLGGDLGWFPRGTLTQPEVEEAVFALQAGETTAVIKSAIGYHIVNVIERDPQHPLSIEARRKLQELKLEEWLNSSRAISTIEILVP